MKKTKKILTLLVTLMMVMSAFAGCSSSGNGGGSNQEGDQVAAIFMALNSDYWHMIEAGCINAGSELGMNVKVMGPTSESDVTGQIAMIEDQITAGAKGLVLAPCEPKAVIPVLEKAKEKGIPVVIIDSDLEEANAGLRASFIGTSEFEAGKEVGNYVVENFEPGEIAIIRGIAGNPSHNARENGFKEVVEAASFKIITVQPADSERGKAVSVTENILESSPKVSIIYCTNDEMALGSYQAVEAKKKTDQIFIIGFDGSPDAIKSIKEGKLGASLAQKPIEMGYKGVEAIKTLLAGGTLEDRIFTSTLMVDKANVEEFEKQLNAELEKATKK